MHTHATFSRRLDIQQSKMITAAKRKLTSHTFQQKFK